MSGSVDEILASIITLLQECGCDAEVQWFAERREILRNASSDSHEFTIAIRELDNAIAGMGGFADIPLSPGSESMTVQDVRDRQWEVAESLGDAIDDLMSR